MNIDIVNKQVSKKLGMAEKTVASINQFYWNKVREHIYSYSPQPVNVENLFVLHPDKYLLKHAINNIIVILRKTMVSPKYKDNSVKREALLEGHKKALRNFLKIRKINKFTN